MEDLASASFTGKLAIGSAVVTGSKQHDRAGCRRARLRHWYPRWGDDPERQYFNLDHHALGERDSHRHADHCRGLPNPGDDPRCPTLERDDSAFSVTPAQAAQLVILAQPTAPITAGTSFGLSFAGRGFLWKRGTIVQRPGDDRPVKRPRRRRAQRPQRAQRIDTAMATNGVATFSGLSIDTAAAGYTIQANGTASPRSRPTRLHVPAAASTIGRVGVTAEPNSGRRLFRLGNRCRGHVRQPGDPIRGHRVDCPPQ